MYYETALAYKGEIQTFRPYAPAKDREAWEQVDEKVKTASVKEAEQHIGYAYPMLPATKYMEFCRIGDRKMFEDLYFDRRRRLNAFVMAECAEYQGRFLDDEGYGEDADKTISHRRAVYFLKSVDQTAPFFVTVDRMKADREHTYELLWHMNEDWAQLQGRRTVTKNLTIFTAEQTPQWSLIIGQEEPEWQGYVATASIQGCYAPVPTLSQQVKGADRRMVTVLYPASGWGCPVESVEASPDPEDTVIRLKMKDGSTVELDERALKKETERP